MTKWHTFLEKELWEKVLVSIAEGTCKDPKSFASLALKTREIDFSRWFA